MEIWKDKKILVGGLAVIGGIALVSYLLKSKAPRRNSEGFFNAGGMAIPKLPAEVCNLPNNFVRRVVTNDGVIKSFCGRYYRVVAMIPTGSGFIKGFQHRLQVNIANTPFYKGSFINQNGAQIITTYQIISSSDYESAFINGQNC